jgi:hypothetical protein
VNEKQEIGRAQFLGPNCRFPSSCSPIPSALIEKAETLLQHSAPSGHSLNVIRR